MKQKVKFSLPKKRFANSIKRKRRKKRYRRIEHEAYLIIKKDLKGDTSYQNQLNNWLPPSIEFIINNDKTKFVSDFKGNYQFSETYNKKVPKVFSLIEFPKESYEFIRDIAITILTDKFKYVEIDYIESERIELSAQIYFDMILSDIDKFIRRRNKHKFTRANIVRLSGKNIVNEDIQKLLFSVGSPAIINKDFRNFEDIIPYKLCVHNKEFNKLENAKMKEIHSTQMVDYVLDSLATVNKKLKGDAIEDLSVVIGEILINAEEHSTTKYRYSTGYFQKYELDGENFGIFHLAIMNFGDTIYEKFKSEDCTNYAIKNRMKKLSSKYTKNKFWSQSFEEETLWTLYALQQGITSVSIDSHKRGNGSIQFIESFFNLKGSGEKADDISRMAIISGNTNIIFDGKYEIRPIQKGNDNFKMMTFNKSNNIEDKPDNKYVKFVDEYFPGTIINARILINKDDVV